MSLRKWFCQPTEQIKRQSQGHHLYWKSEFYIQEQVLAKQIHNEEHLAGYLILEWITNDIKHLNHITKFSCSNPCSSNNLLNKMFPILVCLQGENT